MMVVLATLVLALGVAGAALASGGSFSFGKLDNDFAIPGALYHGVITVKSNLTGDVVLASQTFDAMTGSKTGV